MRFKEPVFVPTDPDADPPTIRRINTPKPGPRETKESDAEKLQDLEEQEHRKRFIEDWIKRADLTREQIVFTSAYVLETPGTWRQYLEGSCEVQTSTMETSAETGKPVLTVVFEFITEGEDDGWTTTEEIPLSK
jgi:hypothetical protein